MGKRYGRNQKRQHREEMAKLEFALNSQKQKTRITESSLKRCIDKQDLLAHAIREIIAALA